MLNIHVCKDKDSVQKSLVNFALSCDLHTVVTNSCIP